MSVAGAASEVRSCAGCGSAAAVQVNRYERRHLFGLVSGGASEMGDWVCQRCGRPFTLHPTPWIWALAVVPAGLGLLVGLALAASALVSSVSDGVGAAWPALLGAAVVGGVSGGVMATFSWPSWVRMRNPTVPDAEVPEVRFTETVSRRRCGCGHAARCVEVTANRTNGIYTGTEYGYRCTCGRQFTIDSPLSSVLMLGGGAFLLALSSVCVPSAPEGWSDWALAGFLGTFGALAALMAGWRLVARLRFPRVPVE